MSHAAEVSKVVAAVRANKEEFRQVMATARDQALAEWRALHPQGCAVSFEEYFAAGAEQWAEDFANHRGLAQACRDRGLK